MYDVYASFMRSCRLVVTGEYEAAEELAGEARLAGLSSHGTNTEMAHAGQMFCVAWDRGQLGDLVGFVEVLVARHPDVADLADRPGRLAGRSRAAPPRRRRSSTRS